VDNHYTASFFSEKRNACGNSRRRSAMEDSGVGAASLPTILFVLMAVMHTLSMGRPLASKPVIGHVQSSGVWESDRTHPSPSCRQVGMSAARRPFWRTSRFSSRRYLNKMQDGEPVWNTVPTKAAYR
jgi:hypothetical protein